VGFRISGRLEAFWPDHLIHHRCATIKPHDRLRLWIDHLVLNCRREKRYPCKSILVGSDGTLSFPPIAEAGMLLEKLLDHFWNGLSEPLRFFSETSFEYASRRWKGRSQDEALAHAKAKWNPDEFNSKPGESEDPYHNLVFGKVEALDEQFASLAVDIFEPILKYQQGPR